MTGPKSTLDANNPACSRLVYTYMIFYSTVPYFTVLRHTIKKCYAAAQAGYCLASNQKKLRDTQCNHIVVYLVTVRVHVRIWAPRGSPIYCSHRLARIYTIEVYGYMDPLGTQNGLEVWA